jgi:hypothetical protein
MAIRRVDCYIAECDRCGQPIDDFDEVAGIPHFASEVEAVVFIGGVHNGDLHLGQGASAAVLLADGSVFCYACKILPHRFVADPLMVISCGRCGILKSQHPDEDEQPPPPGDITAVTARRRAWGMTARTAWCDTACTDRHQFPEQGIAEPADKSRIEFGYASDLYTARRDDEQFTVAGWPAVMRWTLYPDSVGHTWSCLERTFGPCLRHAVLLGVVGVVHYAGDEV